jgi:hypothetical protein
MDRCGEADTSSSCRILQKAELTAGGKWAIPAPAPAPAAVDVTDAGFLTAGLLGRHCGAGVSPAGCVPVLAIVSIPPAPVHQPRIKRRRFHMVSHVRVVRRRVGLGPPSESYTQSRRSTLVVHPSIGPGLLVRLRRPSVALAAWSFRWGWKDGDHPARAPAACFRSETKEKSWRERMIGLERTCRLKRFWDPLSIRQGKRIGPKHRLRGHSRATSP